MPINPPSPVNNKKRKQKDEIVSYSKLFLVINHDECIRQYES